MFDRIFAEYYPKVKNLIHGLLKSNARAEELSQDVFMKLWEKKDILYKVNIGAYLYTMARNHALNDIRRRNLETGFVLSQSGAEEFSVSVESEYYAKEMRLAIDLAVECMPQRRRDIYEMSRVTGLSNEEIAERLNISKKTVENQITAALAHIRRVVSV